MVKLSRQELRKMRLFSQGLSRNSDNVANTIQQLCGLQSQELASASLAIHARTKNIIIDTVKHARESERSIVLTWAMRGTMHLVTSADYHWLNQLLGASFIQAGQRRYKELNLSAEILEQATNLILKLVREHGGMTRPAIAQALAPHGIPVAGQAIAHIVSYAALAGQICFGAEQNGDLTYVAVADWLEGQSRYSPPQPEAELSRRYIAAYAPATLQDFAVWSGLRLRQAKAGFAAIASELLEVEVEGTSLWMHKSQRLNLSDSLALLPRYDNYWLGYQNRALMIEDSHAKAIHPGGGLIHPALVINGEAKANWRIDSKQGKLIVKPFAPFASDALAPLNAELAAIGRFLKQKLSLVIENP